MVTSIVEARWAKSDSVDEFSVQDVMRVVLAQLERGEIMADHVVICLGSVGEDKAAATEFYQAGSFSPFAQLGLIERVKLCVLENAERK